MRSGGSWVVLAMTDPERRMAKACPMQCIEQLAGAALAKLPHIRSKVQHGRAERPERLLQA